ncbi:MAG: class I SAM-dependent methyltransferase [Hyphomicrobiales bacterium]|nr:class I SAM-dependent methyltransferase [Hyphomicrobiales bacterium]
MAEISPDHFIDSVLGYQKTAALKAALALDLFTAISQGTGDLEPIARSRGASGRGLRILCDYLTVQGFLEKEEGCYKLTGATQTFLTTNSPAWMGSIVDFLAAPEMTSLWLEDPVSFVKKGGSTGLANIASDNPVWVKFAEAMVPFVRPVAAALAAKVAAAPAPPRRVLDIAAGHGIFGISVAQAVPHAEITAIDWQAVLAVAQKNAKAAGIAERYHAISGSAFELEWGEGFDLVLLTNFLHHFDRKTCVALLEKARRSLNRDGQVLAVELVPNEDRISPPFPASFAFMMLGSTPSGDAYTARELEKMGDEAGFERVSVEPVPPTPESIVSFGPA